MWLFKKTIKTKAIPILTVTEKHSELLRPHQPGCSNRCCLCSIADPLRGSQSLALHVTELELGSLLLEEGALSPHHPTIFFFYSNTSVHWKARTCHTLSSSASTWKSFNPLGDCWGSGIPLQWLTWTQVAWPSTLTAVWVVNFTWNCHCFKLVLCWALVRGFIF